MGDIVFFTGYIKCLIFWPIYSNIFELRLSIVKSFKSLEVCVLKIEYSHSSFLLIKKIVSMICFSSFTFFHRTSFFELYYFVCSIFLAY